MEPDMADSFAPLYQSLNLNSSLDNTGSFTVSAPNTNNDNSCRNSRRSSKDSAAKTREGRGSVSSMNSADNRHSTTRQPAVTSLDPATATASYDSGNGEADGLARNRSGLRAEDSSASGSAGSIPDAADQDPENMLDPDELQTPIIGFETMEQRAKVTVFKIQVNKCEESWILHKRFSEFTRLNEKLEKLFPGFRFALPPKRWFRSNFDQEFLEERMLGLTAFLSNITGVSDICNSQPVREFFRFDNPPGPFESTDDSRVLCETLEERLNEAHVQLEEREERIKLLEDEVEVYRKQVEILTGRLRELASKDLQSPTTSTRTSLAECDQPSPPYSPSRLLSRDVSVELAEEPGELAASGSQPLMTSTPLAPAARTRAQGSPPQVGPASPIS